tara:strand:- start:1092 stop:1928 length:837 start_codon:yes stop_codon:yes gene_type:complete
MIFTYQNRQSSLYNKTNTRVSNNTIVASIQPPPTNITPNRSIYSTIELDLTDDNGNPKFTRYKISSQKNPIKHYRRQHSASIKRDIIDMNIINMPGKTIVTNEKTDCLCNIEETLVIKNKIFPNNEKCTETFSYQDTDPYLWKTLSCNKEDKIIKPAQTNMSQQYSPSMAAFRYRKGQTYTRNLCHKSQTSIKNNGNECSNNIDSSFTTNKHTINNGTTSITDYRRQYGQNYNENSINILNNSICCNNIEIKDPNYIICKPKTKSKFRQTKNICTNVN